MINNITIMGRLTKDPEYNITTTNTPVVNFTLAVQRTYSVDKEADFIDCTAWSGTADFIKKYFAKGQMIAVQGRVRTDTYTDKEGNSRKSFKVVVHEVSFCESKGTGTATAAEQTPEDVAGFSTALADDLPF